MTHDLPHSSQPLHHWSGFNMLLIYIIDVFTFFYGGQIKNGNKQVPEINCEIARPYSIFKQIIEGK